jgi:hypothetical protein
MYFDPAKVSTSFLSPPNISFAMNFPLIADNNDLIEYY